MTKFFSTAEVNTGRQIELDLAKAMIVVLMIWSHVYDELSTGFVPSASFINTSWVGSLFMAPTFMFCMGIGMVYTCSNTPRDFASRGVKIFLTGLLLVFFRDVIPGMGSYWILGNEMALATQVCDLGVDILQFAALAFLMMALLRRLGLGYGKIFGVSILMSVVCFPLEGVQTECYAVDQLLGYFWGTETESYFPLFNWFIFVAAGCLFGKMYRRLQCKQAFHRVVLPVGLAVTAAYLWVCAFVDQSIFLQFSKRRFLAHKMLPDALMCVLCNMGLISLMYYAGRIVPARAAPVLTYPSKHINKFYCVSWVLIMFAGYFAEMELANDFQTIAAWIACFALSTGIIVLYNCKLKMPFQRIFGSHYAFWMALVVIVVVAVAICGYMACDGAYPNFLNGYLLSDLETP